MADTDTAGYRQLERRLRNPSLRDRLTRRLGLARSGAGRRQEDDAFEGPTPASIVAAVDACNAERDKANAEAGRQLLPHQPYPSFIDRERS